MLLDDKAIRNLLLERLNSYKNCCVYEEVTVPSGKARADLVAVNGHVTAYEIKSDHDSLYRLGNQIAEYDLNFERNFIVVGEKFSSKIESIVPKYWGIVVVHGNTHDQLKMSFIRQAKLNPNLSFNSFLGMLTSDQVKYLAKKIDVETNKISKTGIQKMFKQEVIKYISAHSTKGMKVELKRVIREVLKGRNIREVL